MSSVAPSAVQRRSVRTGALVGLLALLLPVLAVTPAYAGGAPCPLQGMGSTGDPFLVETAAHLALVGASAGTIAHSAGIFDCDLDDAYRQTADITLPAPAPGSSNHKPIGADFNNAFTGVYDGNGFEIRGLVIDDGTADRQGLFGATLGATLTGIRLVDASITGRNDVGALVGRAFASLIEDSTVAGDSRVEGKNLVGGLVGVASGAGSDNTELADVSSAADVFGAFDVGGLIGETSPNSAPMFVSDASATGDVAATGNRAGGLVGKLNGTVLARSFATGDVQADGYDVGGLAGVAQGDTTVIADSYATGAVEAKSTDDGLVGDARIGGLVGVVANSGVKIERSHATGRVTAPSGAGRVGGLVGTRAVTGVTDFVTASFWDTDTSSQLDSGGGPGAVGRSTAQMKTVGTFADAGWAIVSGGAGGSSDVWGICPGVNGGYPFLLWQPIGADCPAPMSRTAAPSFVAPGGMLPLQSPGLGEWVRADGSSTPLTVSSPGLNQVRYAADGIQVTFTGGAGSNASRGLVASPAGEVVCEICTPLAAGGVIEVWMFSTPRLVAAHRVTDRECQRFTVPVVTPLDGGGPVSAGAHTLQLALPTGSGMQAVNVGVTVGGLKPGSVPAGEGGDAPAGLLALGLFAVAGALIMARRPVVTG
jgi:hypothetical protein